MRLVPDHTGLWSDRAGVAAIAGVVLLGLITRVLLFPPSYVLPGVDELGYASDGLLLLEGVVPGYKFAPGAVTTWAGFFYGAISALAHLADSAVIAHSNSTILIRPLFALDAALFDTYADMSGIRFTLQLVSVAISLGGILAAALLGRHFAGWPGALLSGSLMALGPMVVLQSVSSRPYAAAWSLAIASIASVVVMSGRRRWYVAGAFFGLAIASRVEMVNLIPLFVWAAWGSVSSQRKLSGLLTAACSAALTFLIAAPWFVTHLIGNLRKIVTVKLVSPGAWDLVALWQGLSGEGVTLALFVILAGLALRARRQRGLVAGAVGLLVLAGLAAARPSSGGLRHQGDLLVLIVVLSAYALGGFTTLRDRGWRRVATGAAAVGAVLFLLTRTAETIDRTRSGWVEHDAVSWIERNVPAGTPVFFHGSIVHGPTRVPLPTASSADRISSTRNDPVAWRKKLERRVTEAEIEVDHLPRALSMEHMYQQLGGERRYFILGSEVWTARPRYDLRIGPGPDSGVRTHQFINRFEQTGGVFLQFGNSLTGLGEPDRSWVARDGRGVFVYRRPVIGM